MEKAACINDCLLVREAQSGDHAAFEQLIRAHDHTVLRLALRITGSQNDAQDIYQETLLRVFNKLGKFRHECSFSTWIYRIITNVCLDHLRKTSRRRETSAIEVASDGQEYDLLDQVSDNGLAGNPEREVLRRELSAHISNALTRLTPRERMVFELKHYQGLKLRTVGEILNSSQDSVKVSLFRARRKLRFELAGFYHGTRRSTEAL